MFLPEALEYNLSRWLFQLLETVHAPWLMARFIFRARNNDISLILTL